MNNDIAIRVHAFISKQFPLAQKYPLNESTSLLESGIIDSMGVLDLISFLENEFNITINDDDLTPEYFSTIHSISELTAQKLSSTKS